MKSTSSMALIAAAAIAIATFGIVHRPLQAAPQGPVLLDQGWSPELSQALYHKPQGSLFIPTAFLRALRSADGTSFMMSSHMRHLGFITQNGPKTAENPYGWPVGFEVDRIGGVQTAGLTCTACHTAQLRYRGTTMLVEGGGANISVVGLLTEIAGDVYRTGANAADRRRFLAAIVAYGYPKSRAVADFDALVAADAPSAGAASRTKLDTPSGHARVDALAGIAFNAFTKGLDTPSNAKRAIAPTNFPPVWDIWHFDWVQYNASINMPLDRNVGEAIGLRAQMNIVDPVSGALNAEPLRWRTSVDIRNLYWIERQLQDLKPPVWPAAVLGAIDQTKAVAGRALFDQNCSRCHGIQRVEGTQEWHLRTVPLTVIGTDPTQATAFAAARYDATKLGLGKSVTSVAGLQYVTTHIKEQALRDAGVPRSAWAAYNDDRTLPIRQPCAYKARPLVGIWATPPFLHNGTVPSVYDLLSQTRPARPLIGSTEFDPKKLGIDQTPTADTEVIDTTRTGDGNGGHWFTDDTSRAGRIGRALTDPEKYALIEYLKVANYANYPTKTIAAYSIQPVPCGGDPNWALGKGPNLSY